MSNIFILAVALALAVGCRSYPLTTSHVHVKSGSILDPPENNVITVVNNTHLELQLTEDGLKRGTLQPGEQVTLKIYAPEDGEEVAITAVGLQAGPSGSRFVGSASQVFSLQRWGRKAEIWTITHLAAPR
jgi:hypothetical protein